MIKLDMSKYYDCLSWEFMDQMLTTFDFIHEWISWVGNLIPLAFLSILRNGNPFTTFNISRVIHQGDPFSPFLYILMAKGLG